ncbi:MAG: metallophosphoesterase, partial [bacterium]|nr:metallophosphoesterase [bacterium]
MKIVHLSDLHFHRNDKKNKKIVTTLDNVKNKYPKHYLLVTGDITDDGHEKQYENAQKELKKFGDRVFIAPGNHCYGAVGAFYSKERARRFDEKLSLPLNQGGTFFGENKPVVNVVEDGNDVVMFIAIDTNLETVSAFDFACGEVGDSQLNALDNILSRPTIPE